MSNRPPPLNLKIAIPEGWTTEWADQEIQHATKFDTYVDLEAPKRLVIAINTNKIRARVIQKMLVGRLSPKMTTELKQK